MKVAITGHTSGIGKAISEYFRSQGAEVLGFSRSTGHPIAESIPEIVEKSLDCDVFVNNAYDAFHQIELLLKMWEKWQNETKLILVINSMIVRTSWPLDFHAWASRYKIHKTALNQAVHQLQQSPGRCQVSQITPGFCDTPFLPKTFKAKPLLRPEDIAQAVSFIVQSRNRFPVQEVVLGYGR